MNPLNEKLESLKGAARAAGRHAAGLKTEHEQDLYLIGAFGRNVREAYDQGRVFGWDSGNLALILNRLTTTTFEQARERRS